MFEKEKFKLPGVHYIHVNAYLSMSEDPDHSAVFFHLGQVLGNFLLARIILVLLGCLGESLLFGFVPLCSNKMVWEITYMVKYS